MATNTATTNEQVREPEITTEELEQIIGGWSVSTLSQMGGGSQQTRGGSPGITFVFGSLELKY